MKRVWRATTWRVLKLGTTVGVIGLTACDEGVPKDGSVFEAGGQRIEATVPAVSPASAPDPDRVAISEILRDPDIFVRARRLGTLLPTLGPDSVSELSGIFTDPTLSYNIGGTEIELLTHYWAIHDPRAASTWAVEKSPRAYRRAALFATFPVWAKAEPFAALDAAKAWTTSHPDSSEALAIALIRGWYAAGDPPELREFIRSLGVTFNRQRAISAYTRVKLRAEGPDAVMRWAETVSDESAKYKLGVYRQVAFALAPYDIDAALAWCTAHCDGPYGSSMRTMIVRGWMQTDPVTALAWIAEQPLDHEYPTVLGDTFTSWLKFDREPAMAWMADQVADEPPKSLASAYSSYSIALAQDYGPAEGIPFAELIEDEQHREITLVILAKEWLKRDQSACEAWLEQSNLSEDARRRVRGLEVEVEDS